ncbi:hypothetical protein BAZOLSSOX_1337 [uncultured Gammaproteobacteria bacterium]|nr:hypothetical protein [uncultured Gammaproteobacteria bacterium]VVH55332.1 hypothetical protein BAZOLSSOX_1337 [uncultured Gammaproteobacteria bacterium]
MIRLGVIKIHHHTGGLEILWVKILFKTNIHHHTGGLEKFILFLVQWIVIHHHTGGLEKDDPEGK